MVGQKGMSRDEAILNSEEIKPVALLMLPEKSQSVDQSVIRMFYKAIFLKFKAAW